ncbi:MAG: YhjD/YihY/BrkB family envelope integrity protein [Halorhabdus sp.]
MARTVRGVLGTGREVVALTRRSRLSFLAAATAYYAFVSVFPLVLLAVVLGSVFGGNVLAERIVAAVGNVLSPGGQTVLRDALSGRAGRGGATLVGVAVLVWSGSRVFRGLTLAFATIYGTEEETTLLGAIVNAGIALFVLGVAVVAVVVGTAALSWAGIALVGVAGPIGVTLALAIVLLPLYVVLPAVTVSVREAAPGAVTAAVGWTSLSVLFQLYAVNAGQFDVYGVLGGILLFVTWLYVGASVLLLGAVLNAVLAGRDRQLQLPSRRNVESDPTMTGTEGDDGTAGDGTVEDKASQDDSLTDSTTAAEGGGEEIAALRAEIERLEDEIDDRTVHREEVESDLRRYVRRRVRRGHARGWGPYLVLLYGTVMTVGAFSFLGGGWAILAMIVIWLSTLGLYALMLLVGLTFTLLGTPGRLADRVREWRS